MSGRLQGLRILVVDDNDDGRLVLATLLVHHGAAVVTAASAAEGLHAVEQLRPNVLVCDIRMPEVDGYELIRAVREAESHRAGRAPAIAVTGFGSEEGHVKALQAGFNWYLPRPFDNEELVLAICRLVGR